jgi:hypothetical protein
MSTETKTAASLEHAVATFRAPDDMKFSRIDTELARHYEFAEDGKPYIVTINEPVFLHVSASGGHRICDINLRSHYIPAGWKRLYWDTRPGQAQFVK